MRSTPRLILGINISHDATAILINSTGEVLAAIAEERLTRQKYHETFPFQAINWILNYTNVAGAEIHEVAYNWRSIGGSRPYRENIFSSKHVAIDWANDISPSLAFRVSIDFFLKPYRIYRYFFPNIPDITYVKNALHQCGVTTKNIIAFDHQLCHASSAYYSSGFRNALVVSLDGYGDEKSGGIYIGSAGHLRRVEKIPADVSAGSFYANIAGAIGFRRNRHEGKVTGLAALGSHSTCEKLLRGYLDSTKDGSLTRPINIQRNKRLESWNMIKFLFTGRYEYTDAFFKIMREVLTAGEFNKKDIAATAQEILEDVSTRLIDSRMKRHGFDNLAAAGGVFANVALNQKINQLDSVREFFVHPNMGDGGGAYGAAMLALSKHERFCLPMIEDVYWGPDYSDDEISLVIKDMGLVAEHHDNIELKIAELLSAGYVVGRFNGRMEYGPRALCNRSILVQPTRAEINDELNKRLGRTEFMPFAPVVLLEYGPDLFYGFDDARNLSKFMTVTLKVTEHWVNKINAVVHVDGTARPQWISNEVNPSAYRILTCFFEITGIPALINTSFNKHEEPIVCTPRDALLSWRRGSVDALAIGRFLLR